MDWNEILHLGLAKAIEAKAVIGSTTTCLFGLQFEEFGIEHAYSYRPCENKTITIFWGNNFVQLCSHLPSTFTLSSLVYGIFWENCTCASPSRTQNQQRILFWKKNSEWTTQPFRYDIGNNHTNQFALGTIIERRIRVHQLGASNRIRSFDLFKIPGIGAKTPKPLDKVMSSQFAEKYLFFQYWEEILNRRPRTILLSFGSMAKSVLLSEANKAGILKVFIVPIWINSTCFQGNRTISWRHFHLEIRETRR